ncbi:hypothetical protein Tco_0373644 [Tanacetum coccineum]
MSVASNKVSKLGAWRAVEDRDAEFHFVEFPSAATRSALEPKSEYWITHMEKLNSSFGVVPTAFKTRLAAFILEMGEWPVSWWQSSLAYQLGGMLCDTLYFGLLFVRSFTNRNTCIDSLDWLVFLLELLAVWLAPGPDRGYDSKRQDFSGSGSEVLLLGNGNDPCPPQRVRVRGGLLNFGLLHLFVLPVEGKHIREF